MILVDVLRIQVSSSEDTFASGTFVFTMRLNQAHYLYKFAPHRTTYIV